jgi:hypothetical protein
MRNIILPVLGIGALALFLFRRTQFAQNLIYIFRGVKLRGKLFSPKIEITIGIQNPSNQRANFKSIVGVVKWKGNEFANISSYNPVTIAANSETNINVIAEPSVIGLYDTIRELVKGGLKGGKIQITGTANVDNLQLPVNITKAL